MSLCCSMRVMNNMADVSTVCSGGASPSCWNIRSNRCRNTLPAGGTIQQGLGFDDDNDAVSDRFHTYHYNKPGDALHDDTLEDNALYLVTHIAGTDTSYMLCENVTDMTFTRTPATGTVKNVTMSITVMAGDVEKTVSTAAVIRRNME